MTEIRATTPEFRASVDEAMARARELRATAAAIRQRLAVTRHDLGEALERARATRDAVRQNLASLRPTAATQAAKAPDAVLQALALLGRSESDLDELTGELIAAHQAAVATGDDDSRLLFAGALMQIGRHLAARVGPKAAGVIMN